MNKILATEAAWLAGFFEGEGSVGIYNNQPRLSIGQHARSVDTLERVLDIAGVGAINGPYRVDTNPICFYTLGQANEIYRFIKTIYPHLLSRRQEQCNVVLAFIEQMNTFKKDQNGI